MQQTLFSHVLSMTLTLPSPWEPWDRYFSPLPLLEPRGHTDQPRAVLQEGTSPNLSLNTLLALICFNTMVNNNLALEPHVPG